MLKKTTRGIFLGLIILAGSACVTPTHASSAPGIIISSIQAAGIGGAKDELVILYNNTPSDVDISGWCLLNKSAIKFACFEPKVADITLSYYLPSYSSATIASETYFQTTNTQKEIFSLVYQATNQSSGSLVGSADTLQLVDSKGEVVDSYSWEGAAPNGKVLVRNQASVDPVVYMVTGLKEDWRIDSAAELPVSGLEVQEVEPGGEGEGEGDSESGGEVILAPYITEILPNPIGLDAGNEFIELYNPNPEKSINLNSFKLQIGTDSAKMYAFPADIIIPPLSFAIISNDNMSFTLKNTGDQVQLFQNEEVVGEPVVYLNAKDGVTWALVGDTWQYTDNPTPGSANKSSTLPLVSIVSSIDSAESQKKPCASNQYRNPETGRCKLVAAASSMPKPCNVDQERNPDTGRCRMVSTTESGPAPCKEGYERNSETNRCRKIVKMTSAGYGVKGVQTKSDNQPAWYYWLAILAVIVGIVSYGLWEWRVELLKLWHRLTALFAKQAD